MNRKLAIGLLFCAIAAGGYFALNRGVSSKLLTTTSDAERAALATTLIEKESVSSLAYCLNHGHAQVQQALIQAIAERPEGDSNYSLLSQTVFASLEHLHDNTLDSAIALAIRLGQTDVEVAKFLLKNALESKPEVQEAACTVAARPEFGLQESIAKLFTSESPAVRKAAVLAIGPNQNQVTEEGLFRLMSDRDGDVRLATSVALSARGLSDKQIDMGRKLVHAEVAERLSLLVDLKFSAQEIRDPGPWLMRLSQDADPAVRAGAARLAFECKLSHCSWLDELADRDPDGLVRSVAGHYRQRSNEIRAAGGVP